MSEPTRIWMVDAGMVKPVWMFIGQQGHVFVFIDEEGQRRMERFGDPNMALPSGFHVHREQAVRNAIEYLRGRLSTETQEREAKFRRDSEDARVLELETMKLRLGWYQVELDDGSPAPGAGQ